MIFEFINVKRSWVFQKLQSAEAMRKRSVIISDLLMKGGRKMAEIQIARIIWGFTDSSDKMDEIISRKRIVIRAGIVDTELAQDDFMA